MKNLAEEKNDADSSKKEKVEHNFKPVQISKRQVGINMDAAPAKKVYKYDNLLPELDKKNNESKENKEKK